MMLSLIAGKLFGVPLAVEAGYLDGVLAGIGQKVFGIEGKKHEDGKDEIENKESKVDVGGGIAVIPLHNALVQRAGRLDAASSGEMESYARFEGNFAAALRDPTIAGIILDVDSPGGEVAGLFELAENMLAMRGVKPVFAVVNERSMSGAYALTAVADRVFAPKTARIGSIGVVWAHLNQAKLDEKIGVEWTFIKNGAQKLDGNPHEALGKDARERAQKEVDATAMMFHDFVKRARGGKVKMDMVREAQVLRAEEALEAGLIDQVGGLGLAVAEMRATLAKEEGEGKAMAQDQNYAEGGGGGKGAPLNLSAPTKPAIDINAFKTEIAEAVGASMVSALAEMRKAENEEAAERAAVERIRADTILALGKQSGLMSMAQQMVGSGASIDQAREAIMNALAVGAKDEVIEGQKGEDSDPWTASHLAVFGVSELANGRAEGLRRTAAGVPLRAY